MTQHLRFSEFQDTWIHSTLGEIAKFSKGKGLAKSELDPKGRTSCVRYGELYTIYGETIDHPISKTNISIGDLVISEANDVIIPASGETQIDIATASCIMIDGVALGGDLNIIKTSHDGVFLSYYLNSKRKHDIARLSQGISVVHLYASQLARLNLRLPSLPEQQIITAFLSAVDTKIQQLQRKKELLEQYKKGVMQKIFSQEIRFKPALSNIEGDEDGNDYPDWGEKRIGDSVSLIKDGTHGSHKDVSDSGLFLLSAKNIIGGKIEVDDRDRQISEIEFNSIYKNYQLEMGDVLLTIVGTIGRSCISFGESNIAFQRSVAIFRFSQDNPEYIYHYFNSEEFQRELKKRQVISAQPGIYLGELSKIILPIPTQNEQRKIANILSSLDQNINNIGYQLAVFNRFKKGLLQQMFI